MSQDRTLPKVIFFDAVGTLFGIKGSVGDVYSQIARKHGVIASPQELNRAFGKTFSQTPSLAFGEINPIDIPHKEYQWWYRVVCSSFQEVKILDKFTDFELFFQELYVYFATKKPWYVYPDVINCLQNWQQKKVALGIISNFDTRIDQVLELLQLKPYFTSVTLSSEAGFAKPNPKIFQAALTKHDCQPQQAWHIGDSFKEDYQGANAVGIQAFLLQRDKSKLEVENQLPNLNSLG